jgi:hypothetical protein
VHTRDVTLGYSDEEGVIIEFGDARDASDTTTLPEVC